MKCDGSALRKTGDDDALRRNSARDLGFDVVAKDLFRFMHASCVGTTCNICIDYVIPGAHHIAAVDGHRAHRGVGKDKARTIGERRAQMRHDGLEVVSVGTEAVQPNDAGIGQCRRLDNDGVKR